MKWIRPQDSAFPVSWGAYYQGPVQQVQNLVAFATPLLYEGNDIFSRLEFQPTCLARGAIKRKAQFSVSMPGAGAAHLCRVQDSGFQQAGAVQNIWNVASQLSGKPKYFLSAKGCALSACLNALSIRYLLSSGNNA